MRDFLTNEGLSAISSDVDLDYGYAELALSDSDGMVSVHFNINNWRTQSDLDTSRVEAFGTINTIRKHLDYLEAELRKIKPRGEIENGTIPIPFGAQ